MAYLNATASGAFDLLEKLRAFVTSDASLVAAGRQWEQLDVGRSGAIVGNESTAVDAGIRVSGTYLDGLSACTIAGHMRFDPYHNQEPGSASSRQGLLFCSGDANGRSGVRIYVHGDGSLRFGIYPTSSATPYHEVSSGALANNTWYHVAARFSGGTMTLFVDGAAVASTGSAAWPASHLYAYFLSRFNNGSQNFRGRITSWGVWQEALSDADIALLATNQDPRTVGTGGPDQYWSMCHMQGVLIENMATGGVNGVMDNTSSNGWTQGGVGRGLPTSYMFKAPGLSGTEEIYLTMRLEYFPETLHYVLGFKAAMGYDAGAAHYAQPSSCPSVWVPIWDDSMPFWAVANGQRLGFVFKVSTTYQSGYLGKILPYGTPSQYPYPVLCAGMSIGLSKWSDAAAENAFFGNPEYTYNGGSSQITGSSAWLRSPFGSWFGLYNSVTTHLDGVRPYPYYQYADDTAGCRFGRTIDDQYALMPITFYTRNGYQNGMMGEVDGFYWVSGEGNAAENVVTVGGVQHLVFQNNTKSGNNDYMAMRLQ